jgi:hypothetical protein
MANPEHAPQQKTKQEQEIRRDVISLKDLFILPNAVLKREILTQNQNNLLVRDAIEEVDYFYDDNFLPEADKAHILRLAHAAPSERNILPVVTVTRLLLQISQVEGFPTERYGLDVVYGTSALTRKTAESENAYIERLVHADSIKPAQKLLSTQGKDMFLKSLPPAYLPHSYTELDAIRDEYQTRYAQYEDSIPKLFGKGDTGLWTPKIKRGMEIGKTALGLA